MQPLRIRNSRQVEWRPGGAFFLWDAAIKRGDPRRIGLLAFATPILSTVLLLVTTGQPLQWNVAVAAVLVVGAAAWGSR